MSKIESLVLGMFFGLLPVLLCIGAAGFVNIVLFEESGIAYWAMGGLVGGIVINAIFFRRWVRRAYQINNKILAAVYLFYSVVAVGMDMGVPVFNLALGIIAGVYSARRMHFAEADEEKRSRYFKKTAGFCATVMVLMCCLITLWAIAGRMIGSRF